MQRLLAIAILGAMAVVPTGMKAQHRGFGGGMGGGMRFSGGGGRGAFAGPAFRTGPAGGGFGFRRFGGGFRRFGDGDFDDRRFGGVGFGGVGFGHHPRFRVFAGGCFGCRPGFARRRFIYPYYYPYYPAYYPPYDYVDYGSQGYASTPTVVVQQQPANYGYEDQQLAEEVRGLRDEVRQLREQQSATQQPQRSAVQPNSRPEEPARTITTVLVFRDGHRSEIQNYAAIGNTLWIFNERKATKILISDLDVPATRAANDERGVEFSLPR